MGTALDRHREAHPMAVAAFRLLTLTGARLSEVLNLRWEEIGEPADAGTRSTASALIRRTRWRRRSLATVLAQTRWALAGVGARPHSSRIQARVRSLSTLRSCG
ncbi:MAG: hypothetical protein OXF78_12035 [Rhodospirillales bacterium]|nr:hypothetical protein [Rhodospirillales bacterium]